MPVSISLACRRSETHGARHSAAKCSRGARPSTRYRSRWRTRPATAVRAGPGPARTAVAGRVRQRLRYRVDGRAPREHFAAECRAPWVSDRLHASEMETGMMHVDQPRRHEDTKTYKVDFVTSCLRGK